MTVLDRYISREFLMTFCFVLLTFLCLYLIIDFFERIRMFLSNDARSRRSFPITSTPCPR